MLELWSLLCRDYVFDFDPSWGTVLNQLNLPVLFFVTYCIVVVFPSLFLFSAIPTTVPRFFRRLQKCSPRVNINDDNTKPTNLFMVVGWLVGGGM